jgi:hypothetical protein
MYTDLVVRIISRSIATAAVRYTIPRTDVYNFPVIECSTSNYVLRDRKRRQW